MRPHPLKLSPRSSTIQVYSTGAFRATEGHTINAAKYNLHGQHGLPQALVYTLSHIPNLYLGTASDLSHTEDAPHKCLVSIPYA